MSFEGEKGAGGKRERGRERGRERERERESARKKGGESEILTNSD